MNACTTYDFTSFNVAAPPEQIRVFLETHCKNFVFQKEIGELNHREHYQGRFVLGVKRRLAGVQMLLRGSPLEASHLSVTSNENRNNMFYVMKPEGRTGGPWRDLGSSSCASGADGSVGVYIPRRVRGFAPFPWQSSLLEIAKLDDDRRIDVVYDESGGIGKTTLITYMATHHLGIMIPPMNDYQDMMAAIIEARFENETPTCFLIDLPRAMDKKRLYQLWSAIETIKGGYAFDKRYKFKERRFEPPAIIVFTNVLPEGNLLSADRWNIWQVTYRTGNLVPYNPGEIPIGNF